MRKPGSGYSLKEKAILEAALKIMFQGEYDDATGLRVSQQAMLKPELIGRYYGSNEEMRMAAMKYAAVVWIDYVKTDLEKEGSPAEKLQRLLRHYIAGSESHPQSLSLYIDIWKKIRDLKAQEGHFLRRELVEIYQYYVSFFQEAFSELSGAGGLGGSLAQALEMEHLAWIMVVISDGFHIQSFLQPHGLDFEKITRVIGKLLSSYQLGNGAVE